MDEMLPFIYWGRKTPSYGIFVNSPIFIPHTANPYFPYFPSSHLPTMWTCPNCERVFKTTNQSHYCGEVTMDDIFAEAPDHLLLAFDRILQHVMVWEPCTVGPARKSVVFANKAAWLIIKPMSKQLDVKFYYDSPIDHAKVKRITEYRGKYAHHIRVSNEEEITTEVLELLKMGYDFAMEGAK